MESKYGLSFPVKSFAVSNELIVNLNKLCYNLGGAMRPFCFFATEKQKELGVVDINTIGGLAGGSSLLEELTDYRCNLFRSEGLIIDKSNEDKKKFLLYDYLLSTSICYVEVPKYKTQDGIAMATYDKFLCTRNPHIMGAWMGMSAQEMQVKYASRIRYNGQLDIQDNNLRFVKLSYSSNGNKVSVPRNSVDATKIACCVPLFMLNAFVVGIKPHLDSKLLRFTFQKDNGTLRVLDTTLNEQLLMSVYKDNTYVANMLAGVDVNSMKLGGISVSSKISRGYIKVPEVGASIYDSTGTRSLNLARLLIIQEIPEADTRFVHVDLNSVVTNYKQCLDYAVQHFPNELANIYKAVTGEDAGELGIPTMLDKLYSDADSKSVFLSTTYYRNLHLFMVSNPMWFPMYTGKPAEVVVSSKNFGVDTMEDW